MLNRTRLKAEANTDTLSNTDDDENPHSGRRRVERGLTCKTDSPTHCAANDTQVIVTSPRDQRTAYTRAYTMRDDHGYDEQTGFGWAVTVYVLIVNGQIEEIGPVDPADEQVLSEEVVCSATHFKQADYTKELQLAFVLSENLDSRHDLLGTTGILANFHSTMTKAIARTKPTVIMEMKAAESNAKENPPSETGI